MVTHPNYIKFTCQFNHTLNYPVVGW